jgi:hypothetical protein
MGMFNDYPHYYEIIHEGEKEATIYAQRPSENSEFILSSKKNDFTVYGINYLGTLVPNFLGTQFLLYDNGIDESLVLQGMSKEFLPRRRLLTTIEYDSNFFAEKPRTFKIKFHAW